MTTKREEEQHQPHHVMSVVTYLAVWAALMILLVVTVWVSILDLGFFSRVIAITIAAIKAGLIITYFMHLRYSESLVWVFAGLGFLWVILMLFITLSDYIARGLAPPVG